MEYWNGGVSESEPSASSASDPSLVLEEWLATRGTADVTHEVRTCYDWATAWQAAMTGWEIDAASWQRREMVIKGDRGGWVILLSRRVKNEEH